MLFDKDVLGRLVVWIIFVFLTDVLRVGSKGYDYFKYNSASKIKCCRPPKWLFGPVWIVLDVLRLVFIFIFVEWSIDVNHWSFLTVVILFIIQELLKKTWPFVFFKLRYIGSALFIVFVMFVLSITITIVTPVGNNIGADVTTPDNFKYMLMAFFGLYTLWLFYAMILNLQWFESKEADKEEKSNEPLLGEVKYKKRR